MKKEDMVKLLKSLQGRHSIREIFSDFVNLTAITISNAVDLDNYEEREPEYLKISKKYDADELKTFAHAYGSLVMVLNEKKEDVLGEIYMTLELGNKDGSQYFTPMNVARLMSELTFDPTGISEEGKLNVMEPTSGSGVMIIALHNVLVDRGYDSLDILKVYCNDIDDLAVKMCYIQLSIIGIDGICNVGNALTEESRDVWYTPKFVENYLKVQACGKRSMTK